MSLPMLPSNAACPRCGEVFRCGAADASCACFGLDIGAALREQLASQYSQCLCVTCLQQLRQIELGTPPAPASD